MATHSCLENPMDTGAWQGTAHGVAESDRTEQLSMHYDVTVRNRGCFFLLISTKTSAKPGFFPVYL